MHENRETSGTSRSNQDRDQPEKAIRRTAGGHVPEESDRAVVPVNLSNNEEHFSAEAGEERARTKENIVQSNTDPTQSGARVSQGLGGVRQVAKEKRQERFTALLHHVSMNLLRDSFFALKRQAAPGVDGVTWKEYEIGLEGRLADLHSRIHRGAYRAQPSRRVYITEAARTSKWAAKALLATRSPEARHRRDRRGQSDVHLRVRARAIIVRVGPIESGEMLTAGGDHGGPGWQAARAILHAMELRARTAARRDDEPARAVRRHARCESALRNAGERVSDGVPWLLCSVSVRPAAGCEVRRSDAA